MEILRTDYLPWKPTYLVPLGDIQLGANGVDLGKLKEDIQRGLDHDAYFIGLGDFCDNFSPSGRSKYRAASFYDSAIDALESDAERRVDDLKRILEPTVGRWWGFAQGHHYFEFGDGTTTDTRLAEYLETPFLGDTAFIQPRWGRKENTKVTASIFATHGVGSGQTQAAPLNKLERFSAGVRADLYLINHYARRGVVPRDVLEITSNGKFTSKTVFYVATGGYAKAYVEGSKHQGRAQDGYAAKGMMTPTALGGVLVKMTPYKRRDHGPTKIGVDIEVTV